MEMEMLFLKIKFCMLYQYVEMHFSPIRINYFYLYYTVDYILTKRNI